MKIPRTAAKTPCTVATKFIKRDRTARGLVLVEMLMVVGLLALIAGTAILSFGALWGNLRFKRQADELVNVFQMAQNAAAQSNQGAASPSPTPNVNRLPQSCAAVGLRDVR